MLARDGNVQTDRGEERMRCFVKWGGTRESFQVWRVTVGLDYSWNEIVCLVWGGYD